MARFKGEALVIGGSIAGLLSARILADHFDRVLILERDLAPSIPAPRKGVPQSFHSHLLLARGVQILEQLFPGFCEQLKTKGAVPVDLLADYLAQVADGKWAPRFQSGVISYGCTRNLIEWLIRKRLSEFKNIQVQEKHQVLGLVKKHDKQSIKGVICRTLKDKELLITAQLVVDASGRGSKAPQWIHSIGYQKPNETRIDPILSYGSRIYQCPENFDQDWKGIVLGADGIKNPRSAILIPVEGNLWSVTLGGYGDELPPQDDPGFLDFVRQLRSPVLYDTLKKAQPITPVYRYRGTINRRRHFEALSRFPENFIVLGDAACAFNPTHGKGVTNAGLSVLCLDRTLEQQPSNVLKGFSRKFQKQLAEVNSETWDEVIGSDSQLHTVNLKLDDWSLNQLLRPYVNQVMSSAQNNPQTFLKVLEIVHQLKPKTSFFDQDIMADAASQFLNSTKPEHLKSNHNQIPRRQSSITELEENLQHQYIYSNNVRLHLVSQGDGPLMLFLHGFPEFWYSWRHQIPEFAQDNKVVALDLRGYNDSDKPTDIEAYRLSELVNDVQGVIKGLGYDDCVLVGHDWGGAIAWSFAYAHSKMVNKLIVMNCPHPALFQEALKNNFGQILKSWYIGLFQLPILPELILQADDYRAIASVFTDHATQKNAFSPKDIETFKNAAAKRGVLTAMINYYRSNLDVIIKNQSWNSLEIPTLLLWGEDDFAFAKELTQGTKDYVRYLQIRYLKQCNHWTQQEQPELVNKYMREFLSATLP